MAKKPKIGDLVIVEWEDSAQPYAPWRFLTEIEADKPIHCITVGWLLHDAEMLSIAQNMGDIHKGNAQASGVMRIAARSVVKMKKIKKSSVSCRL